MSRSVSAVRAASLVVCIIFSAAMAHAQYRASIQGVVTDAQGAVVADAKITLTDVETNRKREVTSNAAGVYTFSALAPSHYKIEVDKTGFKKKLIDDVTVIAEQANSLNVELDIGGATETVTVNGAEAPLIDTETAQIGGTVDSKQIQTLPSFGRDVFQLAQLAPGVFGDGAQSGGGGTQSLPGTQGPGGPGNTTGIFATENGPQVIANGNTYNSNGISIDGVSTTSVSWGGTTVITPNEDSVKEVKVITNSYDAENGRYSGAQIQVISQNGTNNYHGSFFYKIDRPGLNAHQRWGGPFGGAPQRNSARFNDFGGSVGGPIWKDKIFGFFSYETVRNHSTTTGTGWYETPQFLSMAPANSIASKFLTFPGEGVKFSSIAPTTCNDIGLIEGTNCATIAGQGLDLGRPLNSSFALGQFDPSWSASGSPGLGGDGTNDPANLDGVPDLMFVNTINPTTNNQAQYNGRIDFNASSKDLVAFSIYRVPVHNTGYNGPARPMNFFHHDAINEAETALWNHTFSPSLINEARMNAAGWRWNEIKSNPQEPWGLPTDNIDSLGTAGPQNFGAQGLSVFSQWTYNVKDTLTKVHKSHMLKFGAEVTKLYFLDEAPWSARPSFNFRNFWDFLNDAPYFEGGNFDPNPNSPTAGQPTSVRKDTRSTILGFFVQDNYKARPNLTLNIGLRYEYFGPLHDTRGRLSSLVLGSGASALTGASLRQGGNLATAPKTNFGPQLGFAWSPREFNDKMVFRGGFGIGFTGLEEAISLNGRGNPPLVSGVGNCCWGIDSTGNPGTNPGIVYGVPADVHSFNGYPSNPFTIASFDSNNVPTSGTDFVTGFPAHIATMYTYRYSLDAQYDLGSQWVATLGYQGSTSHHLTRQYNENIVFGAQGVAFNPHFNFVDWYAVDANANFNAVLAGLRHRFSHSFEGDASYRWSKSKDDASGPYQMDLYPFNPKTSWGPSDYDVRHAFKIFGVWSPTIFHGSNSWMEKVVGGWTLSGIMNFHSGFPWTPQYGGDLTGCNLIYQGGGYCNVLPASYLGGAGHSGSTDTFKKTGGNFPNGGNAYFTPPSITQGPSFNDIVTGVSSAGPAPGAPGVGRNSFGGPRYFDIDMTFSKSFGLPTMPVLGEGAKIELRANFFNLFNKLNLTGIDTNIGAPSSPDPHFGQATGVLGGRTVEMQARFSF